MWLSSFPNTIYWKDYLHRDGFQFHSLLLIFSKHLEQYLAHYWCSINICWMNEWKMSRDSLRKLKYLPLWLNVSEKNENFYLKSLSPGNKLFLFVYNLILILFYITFSYQRPNPYKGERIQSVCPIRGTPLLQNQISFYLWKLTSQPFHRKKRLT